MGEFWEMLENAMGKKKGELGFERGIGYEWTESGDNDLCQKVGC